MSIRVVVDPEFQMMSARYLGCLPDSGEVPHIFPYKGEGMYGDA